MQSSRAGLIFLLIWLQPRVAAPALGLRGGSGWISSLVARVSSVRTAEKAPQVGDSVVVRTILDEKTNRWKIAPLKEWPRNPGRLRIVETVPEGVEDCLDNGFERVFVGAGRHSWDGQRLIVGGWHSDDKFPEEGSYPRPGASYSLNLTGEPQARMWGMWVLEPHASGSFEGVTLSLLTKLAERPTIEVWDGPWSFNSCDIRSTCGTAVSGGKRASIACLRCGIGGLDAGEKDEFGDWIVSEEYASGHEQRSSFGFHLQDIAAVTLNECTVEFTGLVGAGVKLRGRSSLDAAWCEFYANSIGIYIDDESSVHVADSSFVDNDLGAFYAGALSKKASAVLRNNSIVGKLWYHKRRPGGHLVEQHFIGPNGATFSNESFSDMLERLARAKSDGLDWDEAQRDETALGILPEDDAEAGGVGRKPTLGALSAAYGAARVIKSRFFDPKDDPYAEKRTREAVAQMSEEEKRRLMTEEGMEEAFSRVLMPLRLQVLALSEQQGDDNVQDDTAQSKESESDSLDYMGPEDVTAQGNDEEEREEADDEASEKSSSSVQQASEATIDFGEVEE